MEKARKKVAQCKVERTEETNELTVSFFNDWDGTPLMIKQLKSNNPTDQISLALDTLAFTIAKSVRIPTCRVAIVPPGVPFPGKTYLEKSATVHTRALGTQVSKNGSPYHDLDILQRDDSAQGGQERNYGLTRSVITNMARHPDLPRLVALDTFVGNTNRNATNLFFDQATNKFCGVDLSSSWSKALALYARDTLKSLRQNDLTQNECNALKKYAITLNQIIQKWPLKEIIEEFDDCLNTVGIYPNGPFWQENETADQVALYKRRMHLCEQSVAELIATFRSEEIKALLDADDD